MTKQSHSYVYILTNITNSVLYIGVTTDLVSRVYNHKHKTANGFTKKYNVNKLIYFEQFDDVISAIIREKQLKGGSRNNKINLIERNNPSYRDLYDEIVA